MSETQAASMLEPPIAVVLVEDDATDAEFTIRALRRGKVEGHIQLIQDGEAALDFLFCRGTYAGRNPANRPRVILLDLKLPKVSGMEVLRQLKLTPETQPIAVVVLSSSAEERDVRVCNQLGANSYVVKPIAAEEFNRVIQQLGTYWLVLNRAPRP